MAKKPQNDADVEENVEPPPAPEPVKEAVAEKIKTIEEEGIGAADPYPTGGAKPAGTAPAAEADPNPEDAA